ncbi:MAG: ion transporter [Tunicatimonas sp.]|uniref:ion transporter n=1 Tax=Tunicatimonas sp. TaxID=1940096 RepID=UPI003C72E2F4
MRENKSALYQILLLFLSIYVLGMLVVESFFITDAETKRVIQQIDLIICLIFLTDFGVNFYRAESKKEFMKWGWVDLISSIPAVDPLRWGRLSRVVRIVRFLRSIKSARILFNTIEQSRIQSLSLIIFLFTFITFSLSASLIIEFERGYSSNIFTAPEALWWATLNVLNAKVSIAQAQSPGGIIATVVLNKIGLLLFAYFNGLILAFLIEKRKERKTDKSIRRDTGILENINR